MEIEMYWIWIIIGVISIIFESLTLQLVSVWFILGSFAALIAYLFDCSFVWQIIIFLSVSFVCLITFLPLIRNKLKKTHVATNSDAIIGKEAIVIETIDNIKGTGIINVNGSYWSAKTYDNTTILIGEKVIITEISGVKAVVKNISHSS